MYHDISHEYVRFETYFNVVFVVAAVVVVVDKSVLNMILLLWYKLS